MCVYIYSSYYVLDYLSLFHIWQNTHIHTYTHIHTHTYTHIHTQHTHTHTYIHTYMHTHNYTILDKTIRNFKDYTQ